MAHPPPYLLGHHPYKISDSTRVDEGGKGCSLLAKKNTPPAVVGGEGEEPAKWPWISESRQGRGNEKVKVREKLQ